MGQDHLHASPPSGAAILIPLVAIEIAVGGTELRGVGTWVQRTKLLRKGRVPDQAPA